MPVQELPPLEDRFVLFANGHVNRIKGGDMMNDLYCFWSNDMKCRNAGITHGTGTWGYTVLRTAYSPSADGLWPAALENLERWVSGYLLHLNRLASDCKRANPSVNDELGRRFALEIIDDREHEILKRLPRLSVASQADRDALVRVFENWRREAIGDVESTGTRSPRFHDFLVIDEDALEELATLPNETPHVVPVSLEERRARAELYQNLYVWLVDSRAMKRFDESKKNVGYGGEEYPPGQGGLGNPALYNGLMRLAIMDLWTAWFERACRPDREEWPFSRSEMPKGSGIKWYRGF